MKKIFLMSLAVALISANVAMANSGYYADTFKPSGGHKVRTNPVGQWFDDQMNKNYVQKKNTNPNAPSYKNGFGYSQQNKNTVNMNKPQQMAPVKPAAKPVVKKSAGGWSS